ncbi:MAG: hypothetical protein IJT02_01375 [Synergistaceae bacterium]|nr:hypothetical protein [Synergistaceae bacterium]
MSIDRLSRWVFFCAGIIGAIFAAYMFYTRKTAEGAACLAGAVGLLNFATRYSPDKPASNDAQDDSDLHDLAILVADIAAMSLQNIGRTVPPTTREIDEIEEKLNKFLDAMPVTPSEREEIAEKFSAARDKARRNGAGRAIMRSARL